MSLPTLTFGLVAREPGLWPGAPSLRVPCASLDTLRAALVAEPPEHQRARTPAGDALHESRVELVSGCFDADDVHDIPEIRASRWCGVYVVVEHQAFRVEVELRDGEEPYGWCDVREHVVSAALSDRIRRALDALGGGK